MGEMDIHVYIEQKVPEDVMDLLATINRKLNLIVRKENAIMADLTGISEAVAAEHDVVDSAVVLIENLADQVAALSTDQASIDSLAQQLRDQAQQLGDAVASNTVAAAPTEPTPVEPAPEEPTA